MGDEPIRVAVVGFQGNVSEHVEAIYRALDRLNLDGLVAACTSHECIRSADALAIPGGESTTISRMVARKGLKKDIVTMALSGKPILGTCAGLILLAKVVNGQDKSSDEGFPAVMDLSVTRNAFGRQRESFETEVQLSLPGLELRETGVFIRAPVINKTWGSCREVAWVDGRPVAALQGSVLGTCFHPELTEESRLYDFLLRKATRGGRT